MSPHTPESTSNSNASLDPKVQQWMADSLIHDQARFPINASRTINEGPDSQYIESLNEKDFQTAFFQAMAQGVALDQAGRPRFFHPKAFLHRPGRRIFRSKAKYPTYAHGINSITMFKNLPENRLNLSLQQDAKSAISEYLDAELFTGNFSQDSELFEIFQLLGPEALYDSDVMDCFDAATAQRQELNAARIARERARAEKALNSRPEHLPNPGSFRIQKGTTIDQVLDRLRKSPNRVGFERVNALKKWGNFINENLPDAHYEEQIISFGHKPYSAHSRYTKYTNDDTYAVIAFDYAGRRCMIAESCGSGGSSSTSAAMKVWRSAPEELGNRRGWVRAFASSKSGASEQGLLEDIRHVDVNTEVGQRATTSEDYIVEAEDRLFRLAFHYFETGKLLPVGKASTIKLDGIIGPEFRRPNPTPEA